MNTENPSDTGVILESSSKFFIRLKAKQGVNLEYVASNNIGWEWSGKFTNSTFVDVEPS